MSIEAEIQSLSPSAVLELFQVETPLGETFRFHAGTNQLRNPVVWQGQTYSPVPAEAEGFNVTARGTLPRPKIRVANLEGVFSAAAMEHDDLIGCKVTRKRTFARFLDAVNFPGSINPSADPNQHFADDVWYVEQKLSENRYVVEWELSSAFDLMGVMLPFRQVVQNTCTWRYRGPECSYTGQPFDKDENPCAAGDDFCSKKLAACRVRHPSGSVPYGGFPGAVRYDK